MASETPTLSIKLLIDQASNVVVLAEVGSDFVNTLYSLLKLPLGNIARLADKHQSLQLRCLSNLHNSVQNLSLECFRTEECQRMLLFPRSVHAAVFKDLKLNMDLTGPTAYYICSNRECRKKQYDWISYYDTRRCSCGNLINSRATKFYECDPLKDETEGVLFKGKSMFFVTDDLRVMPGLPGDLIRLLLNMRIENVSRIEEKVVEFGSKEMTLLLIHSFFSKTTLTDIFMKNQGYPGSILMLDGRLSFIAPVEKESAEKDGKTRVKILLRKSDRKVLYAETSENFVELVFSFLTIPLESALDLVLRVKGILSLGSISNLLRDLKTIFSVSKEKNSSKAVLPPFYSLPNEFPNISSQDPPSIVLYPDIVDLNYESCVGKTPLDPKSPKPCSNNSWGYVEKNLLFVVSDHLVVKQLSSVSSISLLKEMGISLDDVEEKVISIGEVEATVLLATSLWSSSPLSTLLNTVAKKPKQEAA